MGDVYKIGSLLEGFFQMKAVCAGKMIPHYADLHLKRLFETEGQGSQKET